MGKNSLRDSSVTLSSNIIIRNIGVLQTTVAELVTVKEHQRRLHSNG